MGTKYLRTVCFGKLEGSFHAQRCFPLMMPRFSMTSARQDLSSRMMEVPVYLVKDVTPGRTPGDERPSNKFGGVLYAWLSAEELEEISGPKSEEVVSHWLAGLDIKGAIESDT